MKNILLSLAFIAITFYTYGQTATSVNNGNWVSPATWQGGIVPVPGYNVIINHNVTLGTSWAYTSGSITINQNGSLNQATTGLGLLVSDLGVFTNHGSFTFSNFALTASVSSSNTGSLINIDSLFINCDFNNSGTITAYDFLPDKQFINTGSINVTNLFNNGNLTNSGNIITVNIYNNDSLTNNNSISFFDHTNAQFLINHGTMSGSGNMYNHGRFFNESTGNINVSIDFSNVDTVYHDAYFENNGLFTIGINMSNFDTLAGASSGQFCIGHLTYNSGIFTGSFDFCDNTPPASAPYIDYNSGTIEAGIIWCVTPCGSSSGLVPIENDFTIYPNPGEIINISNPFNETASFSIYFPDGRLAGEYTIKAGNAIQIEDLNSGIYIYHFKGGKEYSGKVVKF